ncbi:acyl-CoA oxidase [Aspergillus clavatus NRRL 1]|uniref:Acyl-coenzyme A oxidase n=1 Tax=Aspergillus clavatus (strain ATCC 1007 / CBS 513.65 / DSM 816 / NCTC 3887 / NRRL 1 / QM 1276 / 107) TaxID=344612 RepID=A1CFX0_ASPCL|nr:acyl-CoA oxidase [Aspergillus clavatus NRRL 1]EAW11769.1 acyl-CoA oxidase [Aspergillus clavatus NRRL 1]
MATQPGGPPPRTALLGEQKATGAKKDYWVWVYNKACLRCNKEKLNSSARVRRLKMASNQQMTLMEQARQSATFDSRILTRVIHDGEANASSRRAAFRRVESALGLGDTMTLPHVYSGLDRKGLYLEGLRRGRAMVDDMMQYNHRHFENMTERYQVANSTPYGLSLLIFRMTIEFHGNAEQKQQWLPLIDQMTINGCYAQTELGHGSHLRGIETTASFDEDTGDFVIHSPTITAAKYWPGGLGLSCSHAVVAARLLIRGKDYGMHWFIVQIRSLDDFSPAEGVELGDVGLKMAYNGTCNGYARFSHVRVPRSSLLAAYAQVDRDGSYVQTLHGQSFQKELYAAMLEGRRIIIQYAAFGLAQPLTVATRYSVVRMQGMPMFSEPNAPEVPVVAYKSQHYRLLTLISQAYALIFVSKEFNEQFGQIQKERAQGNLARLPFIHALSTGLKAWGTSTVNAGAEEARKMCGGHGYMALSGLPEMVGAACATTTFEGENYLMWQQLVRYLFKQADAIQAGRAVDADVEECLRDFDSYLSHKKTFHLKNLATDQLCQTATLLAMFHHRFCRVHAAAYTEYGRRKRSMSAAEAWNRCLMRLLPVAHAYTEYMVLQAFQRRVAMLRESEPSVFPVLSRLSELFALTSIITPTQSYYTTSFTEDGLLSSTQFDPMRTRIDQILEELLPDIVSLTDAWDFTDASLSSALGCRDGNVYERLMSWTRQLPVNTENVAKDAWGVEGGIRDLLKRGSPPLKSML